MRKEEKHNTPPSHDYPVYPQKYSSPAIFGASEFVGYLGRAKPPASLLPRQVILCYQGQFLSYMQSHYECKPLRGLPFKAHALNTEKGEVAVVIMPGFGAPLAAATLEMGIAAGGKEFINLGTAGALQPDLELGDLVVCRKAIRDEGTSYHYLPAARYADGDPLLIERLIRGARNARLPFREGSGWTTDAVFRETAAEVAAYASEGVLSVDMEASALFCAASCREVRLASLFVISDQLCGGSWRPGFFAEIVRKRLHLAFDLVVAILAAGDSGNNSI